VRRRWYEHELRQVAKVIVTQDGPVVQSGPFQGMQYVWKMLSPDALLQHTVLPKILGSYEAELHPALTCVLERDYRTIVNIGSSEGYYAIGLALLLRSTQIFAFDIHPEARRLCEQMARLNGVADRVTIGAECTMEHLKALATGRTLVVCDCEGCEVRLLRPDLLPGLINCDLIVELHDCVDPSISQVVPARFSETHDVTLVGKTDRDVSAYPLLNQLSPYQRRLAVSEFNWGPPRSWALLRAKRSVPL
jgi:hypothetical protein